MNLLKPIIVALIVMSIIMYIESLIRDILKRDDGCINLRIILFFLIPILFGLFYLLKDV